MMGVSGRKMRCKLKGKMAHSTVVLPKATGYAGPVGPDLLRRLLGKKTSVPAIPCHVPLCSAASLNYLYINM